MGRKKSVLLLTSLLLGLLLLFSMPTYCAEKSSFISFHLVCDESSPDCFEAMMVSKKETLLLEKKAQLAIDDIAYAECEVTPPSSARLTINFTNDGKDRLYKVTSENINRRLGVIIDKKLVMAPKIIMPIEIGRLQVVGNFSEEELQSIAQHINRAKGLKAQKYKTFTPMPTRTFYLIIILGLAFFIICLVFVYNKMIDKKDLAIEQESLGKVADLVTVKTFLSRQEAEVAKSLLDAEGIESTISADDAGALRPHLTFGAEVRLLVKKEDAEKVRELLK